MVSAYWTIGKQLHGAMNDAGSNYGKQLIKFVSAKLSEEFRQGFDERNLCNMVMYSMLNENDHLYVSKYKLYMPIEEELKKEIERERVNIEQRLEDQED